jgi:hypothetical protein
MAPIDPFTAAESEPPRPYTALVLVVAAALGAALSWLPLPGLDLGVARESGYWLSPFWYRSVALFLVMRWIADARIAPRRPLIGALMLATGAAAYVWAGLALQVTYGRARLVAVSPELFAALTVTTVVGGQAICWWLADQVDRSRALSGGPVVWWGFACAWAGAWLVGSGADLAHQGETSPLALAAVAAALPLLWIAAAPRAWPRTVIGGWSIRSASDAVLTLWAFGGLSALTADLLLPTALAAEPARIAALAALAATAAAIVSLHTDAPPDPTRAWAPRALVVFGGGTVASALVVTVGFIGAGGLELFATPHQGHSAVRVRLTSEDGLADVDAAALAARFDALGVDAEVRPTGARALEVVATEVGDPRSLFDHALAGGALVASPVVRAPARGTPAALRATTGPTGARLVLACGQPTACDGYWVGDPFLTRADVAEARLVAGGAGSPPLLQVVLTEDAKVRFGDWSAANVGQQAVFELDGVVVSAPVFTGPILGGVLTLQGPEGGDAATRARGAAGALANPLTGTWRLAPPTDD